MARVNEYSTAIGISRKAINERADRIANDMSAPFGIELLRMDPMTHLISPPHPLAIIWSRVPQLRIVDLTVLPPVSDRCLNVTCFAVIRITGTFFYELPIGLGGSRR